MKRLLVLTILAASASGAGGEEAAPREIPAARVAGAGLRPGETVVVTGKYRELVDQELILHDCETPFLLLEPELLKRILDFKPERDNLAVSGKVVTREGGGIAMEATALVKAPSDLEIFSGEADHIPRQGPTAGRDLHQLAKRILSVYKRHQDPALLPLARNLFSESLELLESTLRADTLEGHLASVRELHEALADRGLAIQALKRLHAKFPGNASIGKFFVELQCRPYRGRWLTYEEFKKEEGLIQHSDRWMQPREKHLIDTLEWFKDHGEPENVIRKRTDRDYQRLAEKGAVDLGMRPVEVTAALGFPDRVERKSLEGREFDQWSYGNRLYYFYGGLLVLAPEASKK
jgi:hypothetical protein